VLYALDRSTGDVIWTYPGTPPPPGRRITSSPAVATGGTDDVVVFAVDYVNAQGAPTRSRMLALVDDGTGVPTPLPNWHSSDGMEGVPVCGIVGTSANAFASSPSLGADGTIYIGLSAVGDPAPECDGMVPSQPRSGGGLVAIMP
jgi:outer membrane protein assembly factor BamB